MNSGQRNAGLRWGGSTMSTHANDVACIHHEYLNQHVHPDILRILFQTLTLNVGRSEVEMMQAWINGSMGCMHASFPHHFKITSVCSKTYELGFMCTNCLIPSSKFILLLTNSACSLQYPSYAGKTYFLLNHGSAGTLFPTIAIISEHFSTSSKCQLKPTQL